MKTTNEIITAINSTKARSAWDRGVKAYALELIEDLDQFIRDGYASAETITSADGLRTVLLNGARDWKQYSWGGSALIYDGDIAERLCTPSELKKTRNGERKPNAREDWLDVQARALLRAWFLIRRVSF